MTAPLALPPGGGRARPRNLVNIGVLVAVCGGLALFAALVSAYVTLGHAAAAWPPNGFQLDVYTGNMLAATAVMSTITVEWGWYSVRHGDPAQGLWGLLLTAGLGVAFILLLWQLASRVGFGPGDAGMGAFAVVFFAMIAAAGALAISGIVAVLMATGRVLGRQMKPSSTEMLRAVAWYWDFVVASWLAAYSALWLFT